MTKYIEAEAIKMGKHPIIVNDFTKGWNYAIDAIVENAPAADVVEKEKYDRLLENALIVSSALQKYQKADVVEVVRCKDCRYNYANLIPNGSGCSKNVELKAEAEWYCADGERDE